MPKTLEARLAGEVSGQHEARVDPALLQEALQVTALIGPPSRSMNG